MILHYLEVGKTYFVLGPNYHYCGKLADYDKDSSGRITWMILLEAQIVFESGTIDQDKWHSAMPLPNPLFIEAVHAITEWKQC